MADSVRRVLVCDAPRGIRAKLLRLDDNTTRVRKLGKMPEPADERDSEADDKECPAAAERAAAFATRLEIVVAHSIPNETKLLDHRRQRRASQPWETVS